MATGAQIKAMMESHAEGDDSRFYAVASQVAASEARKGHDKLARPSSKSLSRFQKTWKSHPQKINDFRLENL